MHLKRTHTCGQLRKGDAGEEVILNGWINSRRDHGGLIFVDLRDRYGKTQVVFDGEQTPEDFNTAKKLGMEDVIAVRGEVVLRPADSLNPAMPTGEIDVQCLELAVLNEAEPLPFLVTDRDSALEEQRLTYRYLELRTGELQDNLLTRSRIYQIVRGYFVEHDFVEVETPFLMKSTPEGARDYLVPSRLHHGRFYALPQSPQTYKQLLMIAGLDRYFQIVKCFRDEDLRADRQPEFTQIDVEMSFIDEQDVYTVVEGLIRRLYQELQDIKLPDPFPRLTYREAMERYGTDKPDLRYDLELQDFTSYVESSDFSTFKGVLKEGGIVRAVVAPGCAGYSRKDTDALTNLVTEYHQAKGLAWMKVGTNGLEGGVAKFFPGELQQQIVTGLAAKEGDLLLMIGDKEEVALPALGALREELARRENLIKEDEVRPVWIVGFPLVEFDEEAGRWLAVHHPFTAPHPDDESLLETDPGRIRSRGYDLVINGWEIAGGSIRNHDTGSQERVFKLLGISPEEAEEKFGFLLKALLYGAPPHGGIAFGFDRLVMVLVGATQIRDVIAFPKTTSALSLMDGAPAQVTDRQLKELGLSLRGKRKYE
ncbi:MAG: aspartate--tRNA ligase [Fidelibacterota bacterium]|nr:MAG: aspartate--tRNA ligase [Candidatus Neomarinimicrobiota bacterium]